MHPAARKRLVAELAENTKRGARRTTCKRCGAPCLTGDDHDEIALTVTVDEQPLDNLDEMFARLDGRMTFDLVKATGKTAKPGQHNLWIREPWHLDSGKTYGTVHAEHRCERPA